MSRSKSPGAIEDNRAARNDPRAEPDVVRVLDAFGGIPTPPGGSSIQPVASVRRDSLDDIHRDDRAAGVRRQLAQLQAQLAEAQKQLAGELQGRAEDGERIEELEGALAKRDAEVTEHKARIESLRAEVAGTKARAERAESDVAARKIELGAKLAEVDSLSSRLADADWKLSASEDDVRKWTDACKAREGELEAKSRELDREREENLKLDFEAGTQKDMRGKAQAQANAATEHAADLERRLVAHEVEAGRLRSELDEAHKSLAKERSLVSSKIDEITNLEQHLRRLIRAEEEAVAARVAAAACLEQRSTSLVAATSGTHAKAQLVTAKPLAAAGNMSDPSLDISEIEVEASEVIPARQTERP